MKTSRQTKRLPTSKARNHKISNFAQKLRREWKELELPVANSNVVVAVSGGPDSAALLVALDELVRAGKLSLRVIVAHLNHKLRGKESDADARWVSSLARKLGYRAKIKAVSVGTRATRQRENLEQAARNARYEFLEELAQAAHAELVLVAHTLDDQAETVLFNLLRGSGAAGLSGIDLLRPIRAGSKIILARPLLSWARRADTEGYCGQRSIEFRVDQMNADEKYARVRMRKRLLPLMKEFNPRFIESLARATELLREDDLALESAAERLLQLSVNEPGQSKEGDPALRTDLLRLARPALRRRALRQWIAACRGHLRRLEYTHISAVEKLIFSTKSGRVIQLPGGGSVLRHGGLISYRGPKSTAAR